MLVVNGFIIGVEYKHFNFKSAEHFVVTATNDSRLLKANADAVLLRLTIKQ